MLLNVKILSVDRWIKTVHSSEHIYLHSQCLYLLYLPCTFFKQYNVYRFLTATTSSLHHPESGLTWTRSCAVKVAHPLSKENLNKEMLSFGLCFLAVGLCTVTIWYGCMGAIIWVLYPYRQRVPSILDPMGPIRVPENGQISEFFDCCGYKTMKYDYFCYIWCWFMLL